MRPRPTRTGPRRAHPSRTSLVALRLPVVKLGDPARRYPALVGRVGPARVLPQPGSDRPAGRRGPGLRPCAGIVHRDIKPSNLLLDTEGVVWIADFGLAKGEDEGLTQSGDILGTLRYMAPERFRGEGDARADVYALGLTLYELLTLRPGFDSSDRLKLIEQIKTEEPPKPRSIDARIPRDLETIVLEGDREGPQGAVPDRPRRWARTWGGSSPTSRSGRARSAPPSATGGGPGATR